MDYIKQIKIEELREKYGDNLGFVFTSDSDISNKSIETLVETLKNQGITKENPLLVTRINKSIFFVYERMDLPSFLSVANVLNNIGIAKVESLFLHLKNNN